MGDVNIQTRVERHSRLPSRRSDLNYKPESRPDNFIWGGPQCPACLQGVSLSLGTFLIKNTMKRLINYFLPQTIRDALYWTGITWGIILPYFLSFLFTFTSFTYISINRGRIATRSSRKPPVSALTNSKVGDGKRQERKGGRGGRILGAARCGRPPVRETFLWRRTPPAGRRCPHSAAGTDGYTASIRAPGR